MSLSPDSSREVELCEYLSAMNNANQALNTSMRKLRETVQYLESQNGQLKGDLVKFEALHASQIAELKVLITTLQADNGELSHSLHCQVQQNRMLRDQFEKEETKYRTNESCLLGLRQQLCQLNSSLSRMRDSEAEPAGTQLQHLRKENESLQLNMLNLIENNRLVALADRHIWESRLELIHQNYERGLEEYRHTIRELTLSKQHMEVVLNARIRRLESEPLLLRPSSQILYISEQPEQDNEQSQLDLIEQLKRQNALLRHQLAETTERFSSQLEILSNYYERLSKNRHSIFRPLPDFDSILKDCRKEGKIYELKILDFVKVIQKLYREKQVGHGTEAELAIVQLELIKRL